MRISHEELVLPTERSRHQLYEEMKEALSVESAHELLAYLPPVGWADVATKADVGMIRNKMDALRAEMRGETAELRGELRSGMAELRGELCSGMAELRGELRSGMTELRSELQVGMTELRSEMTSMRSEIDVRFAAVDGRFDAVDGRFAAVNGRFDAVDGRFDSLQGHVTAEVAQAKDSMRVWAIATMLTMTFGMTGMMFAITRIGH